MRLNYNNIIKLFIGLIIAVILFHICIVIKIIPYTITWGGRLQNDSEMYVFEIISILINLLLIIILLMKGDFIEYKISFRVINIVLWVFLILFILNTIGNIFAKTLFEKSFAILTGIFAILVWMILRKKDL